MKKLLLLLMLVPLGLKADPKWSSIDVQSRDIAFVTGYLAASIYDLSDDNRFHYGFDTDKKFGIPPQRLNDATNMRCVGWKMSYGLIAGAAVAVCHASIDNANVQFSDIVFGGLGGLTCVVVHF